jgi:NAD-dependent dihydropyrimidine dehydrogenase PreA subunit
VYVGSPRFWTQTGFLAASLFTGLHFHRFAVSLGDEAFPLVTRPAEVDAWLPISSFTSLLYLLKSGVANTVHPAGLVFFTVILLLAVTVRRGFCSWVCPVGTLSEWGHRWGRRLFGKTFDLPRVPDMLLRSVKYLLLAFFVVMIAGMSAEGLHAFIHGTYNRVCDLKMYALFARPSVTTLTVVSALAALSVGIRNFWCRYLCPYGALLGLASVPSPVAVRRDAHGCTGCGRCTRACPNRIAVARRTVVRSPECTACGACVEACPEPEALRLGPAAKGRRLTPTAYAVVTLAALVLLPHAFRALGYWDSDTPPATYRRYFSRLSEVAHP